MTTWAVVSAAGRDRAGREGSALPAPAGVPTGPVLSPKLNLLHPEVRVSELECLGEPLLTSARTCLVGGEPIGALQAQVQMGRPLPGLAGHQAPWAPSVMAVTGLSQGPPSSWAFTGPNQVVQRLTLSRLEGPSGPEATPAVCSALPPLAASCVPSLLEEALQSQWAGQAPRAAARSSPAPRGHFPRLGRGWPGAPVPKAECCRGGARVPPPGLWPLLIPCWAGALDGGTRPPLSDRLARAAGARRSQAPSRVTGELISVQQNPSAPGPAARRAFPSPCASAVSAHL